VVEISRAIGSIVVLDVMAFSVAHLNVNARELTVKMMNRALHMLCAEFPSVAENTGDLVLPRSDLRQRLALENGVMAVLKELRTDRNEAMNAMRSLRFAEFKSPEVLLLSIPQESRDPLPNLSGLLGPAAVSVVPVVVTDTSPTIKGIAGGFEIFVRPEFVRDPSNVMRLVSALEDILVGYNYTPPPRVSKPIKPNKGESDSESRATVAEHQECSSQQIFYERVRELEAELRARGSLL
jgi:hypothetical protein